ncbi:MAG: RagB/SusD family nutrient uptake outer membrane protein [Chitinophagaceae bacterium]|nr:RagB/SusD family nutrient uptake outer membrane protein [Chitinophagaceae bacterium]
MKQRIYKLIIAGVVSTVIVVACDKKLNVTDKNNPTQESYFKTASELQNGVNSIYSTMRAAELVGREWFFVHDMRGSETWAGGAQLEAPRAELLKQASPAPTNAVMTSVWNGCYQMINKANLVLSKAPDVTDNTNLRDRLVGEAKFLRAWAYFELVSQWGDVPLYTQPINSPTEYKGKSPAADIYAAIISDLTDAVTKLPPSYSAADLGRATKGAANTLLGRVQMQKGDYGAAKTALLAVVNSGLYSLVNFSWNFDGDIVNGNTVITTGHEGNAESIFEVYFQDKGDNTFNWGYNGELQPPFNWGPQTVRNQEYGQSWGNVIPSDRILDEFEAGDPRYKMTFYEVGDIILTKGGAEPGVALTAADLNVDPSKRNGVSLKRIYRKYAILDWMKEGFKSTGLNQRIMRYADVLLMLAECEAEGTTPTQAATYINMVRARPGVNMPVVTTPDKTTALRRVMHERAVELAGEEVNNIDILRWRKKGYFPSIMPDPKPGQVDMLPIPYAETSTNPAIR